jgi:hypothetical protein
MIRRIDPKGWVELYRVGEFGIYYFVYKYHVSEKYYR